MPADVVEVAIRLRRRTGRQLGYHDVLCHADEHHGRNSRIDFVAKPAEFLLGTQVVGESIHRHPRARTVPLGDSLILGSQRGIAE